MFKKHMSALSKGGQKVSHNGKGSSQAPMPDRSQINALAQPPGQSMNNYAKATPMAGGMPPGGGPPPGGGGAAPGGPPAPPPLGLGTGSFSGTGA